MSSDREVELALLKSHLGITPKTAHMLHTAGYTSPQSLANSTPNEVVSKFAVLPGMDAKKAKDYARPGRRMVMLGAIEDPEEAAAVVRDCKVWSNKELMRLGIWEDGFNDLTGVEIRRRMASVGSKATVAVKRKAHKNSMSRTRKDQNCAPRENSC